MVYLGCVISLIWTLTIPGPATTQFPLIDFAARAVINVDPATSLGECLKHVTGGNDGTVKEEFSNTAVFARGLRVVGEQLETIGFSTQEVEGRLETGKTYAD